MTKSDYLMAELERRTALLVWMAGVNFALTVAIFVKVFS